ncbi:MAG: MFS transporter [Dehalococcoidia bacterium]|nr:MFS transporter [Dehalococcoidia bacterium]
MSELDGVPGWQRNLYILAAAQFLSALGFSFVQPFFPLYIQELGVSNPGLSAFWAGVTTFAGGIGSFITGPIWGTLADRYGRRPMVIRSMLGGAITVGLMGLVPSVGFLVLLRGLQGIFTGTIAASSALAASQAPKRRVAFALGLIQMAFFLGITGGPLVGGVLADATGHRIPFLLTAVLITGGALVVVFFVRERFVPPPEGSRRPGPIENVRTVLRVQNILPLLGLLLLMRFGPAMITPIFSVFMQDMVAEGAASIAGVGFGLVGLMSAVAALTVARIGRWETMRLAIIVSCFAAAVFYFPQFWVHSPALAVVLFGLTGISQGVLLTTTNALMSVSVSREHQGAVFGVVQSVNALAFGLGPLLGGILGATLGFGSVFMADAALFLLVGVAAWLLLSRRATFAEETAHRPAQ